MKRFLLLILLLFSNSALPAQDCEGSQNGVFLHGNEIRAYINNSGSLFFDGEEAAFQVPYTFGEGPKTISAHGLWMGGIDPGGNLRVSAQTYGLSVGEYDYLPGPLSNNGEVMPDCENWDKVWSVRRAQIEGHIEDFANNGLIDDPIAEIFSWPGLGNPHFDEYNGFELPEVGQNYAPFKDIDGNGIYDPELGDYPMIEQADILPEQITWTVFNDLGTGEIDDAIPLGFEIQLTSWAFNCTDDELLNHTMFNSWRLVNQSFEPIDSLYVGLWTDFYLGCFKDSDGYFGSAPAINSVYAYNKDNDDNQDCFEGYIGYGENPPAQSFTVLNQDLSSVTYYYGGPVINPPPGVTEPKSALEVYNYLTGRWRDGSPLTSGGNGYQQGAEPVSFAFPDNPNNAEGWSLYDFNTPLIYKRPIAAMAFDQLDPGTSVTIDVGYSFFREEGNDHLDNVNTMFEEIPRLQMLYDQGFEDSCEQSIFTNTWEENDFSLNVFPNPTSNLLNIVSEESPIETLSLLNLSGQELLNKTGLSRHQMELSVGHLPKGMYLLKIRSGEHALVRKVVLE